MKKKVHLFYNFACRTGNVRRDFLDLSFATGKKQARASQAVTLNDIFLEKFHFTLGQSKTVSCFVWLVMQSFSETMNKART